MDRRDMLLGAACLATAGAAAALVPRRRVSLLGRRSLEEIIPRTLPGWTSTDSTDLVAATEPGSLASRLYTQTLGRIYSPTASGEPVTVLMAYGDTQSDDLMVHRPEKCYPAFGFALSNNETIQLPLPGGLTVPARRFVASAEAHSETIFYWVRLGEFLPTDRKQQQFDRMRTALGGAVGDGILVRFSVNGPDMTSNLDHAERLARNILTAMRPGDRIALIGTARANAMIKAGV
jgi:EpsI family protein